ncbi:MAG TPA: phosphoribosylformylglycinamidine synthase subunit PurL [Candidatus Hydrothermia bacterium]|nr:phosphoribosylformylglycinamidine synthase subunit PurL [Candidatus Hydrothermia bacterium]
MDKEVVKRHGFTDDEYNKILEILGREPNLLELGIFSTQWSEHCSYKSSKKLLKELPNEGKNVLQGPGENAGVVALKNGYILAFKVESHNHPSAVEPFHGAATGIGGIVRDILSMGVRPIALMDSLRFGELIDSHVVHLFDGVVSGISFYGNCIGVPCIGGEVYFDEPYGENCLVNVCCAGIGREGDLKTGIAKGKGNKLILVGSKTGREGIHGATFASDALEGSKQEKRPSVQIGDPFYEKLLIEAILEVRKFKELIGMQDLGAGGLSTTPAEMAERGGVGIEIDIGKIPVKSIEMTPYEIMLSETQERALLCVKNGSEKKFIDLFKKWGLEAEVIGKVIEKRVFRVVKGMDMLAEIPVEGLVNGVPQKVMGSREPAYISKLRTLQIKESNREDLNTSFKRILASPNIASKKWVYEQYDYTVRGDTVFVPGFSDAAILRIKGEDFGVAMTIDGNGRLCYLNPYEGGKIAVAEAARNLVAVGADPIAVTDGLNFGNPEIPEVYWSFEKVIEGISESARGLDIPVISGNVSFYNETETLRIFPTPIIGMVGIIDPLEYAVDMTVKMPGDYINLVGKLEGNVGGSEYLKVLYGLVGGEVDVLDLDFEKKLQQVVLKLIKSKLIKSAHDVSEGGLLTAIFEKFLLAERLGVLIEIDVCSERFLFGEWQSRFVVSYGVAERPQVIEILKKEGVPYIELGLCTSGREFILNTNNKSFEWDLRELRAIYNGAIESLVS